MSWLALFVALGGTSYAATQLPANSVGTRQLQVGAVTNSKVKPGSLDARALSPRTLSSLKTSGIKTIVVTAAVPLGACGSSCNLPAGTSKGGQANCSTGMHAVAGGYAIQSALAGQEDATVDAPTGDDRGWQVTFSSTQAEAGYPGGSIYAICAP